MEEVLLGDSGILLCKFRKAVGIILGKHALYPYINGEGFYPVHTEKQNALRDFRTHSLDRLESRSCLVYGSFRNSRKVSGSGADLIRRVADILRTEAAPQISQRVRSLSSKLLRLWEKSAVVIA